MASLNVICLALLVTLVSVVPFTFAGPVSAVVDDDLQKEDVDAFRNAIRACIRCISLQLSFTPIYLVGRYAVDRFDQPMEYMDDGSSWIVPLKMIEQDGLRCVYSVVEE